MSIPLLLGPHALLVGKGALVRPRGRHGPHGGVDVVVARVIGDHSARIQSLPADQQCAVADRVVDAKERLKGALKAHLLARPDPAAPVTPEDVHAAVRSMAAARPDDGALSDEESVRSEQEGY